MQPLQLTVAGTPHPAVSTSHAEILAIGAKVADWQLANHSQHRPDDWPQAVGYNGMMALSTISGSRKYHDAMVAMGEKNGWKLGPNHYHADDHIVGQTYVELYLQSH